MINNTTTNTTANVEPNNKNIETKPKSPFSVIPKGVKVTVDNIGILTDRKGLSLRERYKLLCDYYTDPWRNVQNETPHEEEQFCDLSFCVCNNRFATN